MSYTSMKMDPKGSTPPNNMMLRGSMNHFFSGMGLGTVLIRQGLSGWPEMLRPKIVPTKFRGRMTNKQMQATEILRNTGIYGKGSSNIKAQLTMVRKGMALEAW